MKKLFLFTLGLATSITFAQDVMTKELLWELGRVSPIGISKDGKSLIYRVGHADMKSDKINSKTYQVPLNGGTPKEITNFSDLVANKNLSPDGTHVLFDEAVKIDNQRGIVLTALNLR